MMAAPTRKSPLSGKRIVITRAQDQAAVFHQALVQRGAFVIDLPTIKIIDPSSWQPLDSAIARIDEFNYLLLTSVNGARRFLNRLQLAGRNPAVLAQLEIGAIGPTTAGALRESGVRVDFVPQEYQAEGLLKSLQGRNIAHKRFLIPRAKVARDLVPRVLRESGAVVEVVEAYQTVLPAYPPGEVKRRLTPLPDVVTFTSSSTASHFVKLLEAEETPLDPKKCLIASIGPVTSATLWRLGMPAGVEAKESTISGLVEALVEHFQALAAP
jgi:uroporphyrinogen III methyltransferase/synthase